MFWYLLKFYFVFQDFMYPFLNRYHKLYQRKDICDMVLIIWEKKEYNII